MALLEVTNIKKIYSTRFGGNKVQALSNVTFSVEEGEFVAIMGESGSGKTTLLNILASLDRPTSGEVLLEGKNIVYLTEKEISAFRRKNLGFVFQDFNLLDTHTLFENISMPLSLAKISKEDIFERVHDMAKNMGIEHLLKKYPYECSGGQRQRAAICRALIAQPKIIIADEPTGNLDSVNSHELLMTLKSLNEQDGVTIIMVSHDPMIASYSSRFVYIKDGHIAETLQRQELSQDEYFQKIVDINSLESRKLFEKHHD